MCVYVHTTYIYVCRCVDIEPTFGDAIIGCIRTYFLCTVVDGVHLYCTIRMCAVSVLMSMCFAVPIDS